MKTKDRRGAPQGATQSTIAPFTKASRRLPPSGHALDFDRPFDFSPDLSLEENVFAWKLLMEERRATGRLMWRPMEYSTVMAMILALFEEYEIELNPWSSDFKRANGKIALEAVSASSKLAAFAKSTRPTQRTKVCEAETQDIICKDNTFWLSPALSIEENLSAFRRLIDAREAAGAPLCKPEERPAALVLSRAIAEKYELAFEPWTADPLCTFLATLYWTRYIEDREALGFPRYDLLKHLSGETKTHIHAKPRP